LIRDYSYSAAASFADDFFDWVYIDGIHDYENIYRDLASFVPKKARRLSLWRRL